MPIYTLQLAVQPNVQAAPVVEYDSSDQELELGDQVRVDSGVWQITEYITDTHLLCGRDDVREVSLAIAPNGVFGVTG